MSEAKPREWWIYEYNQQNILPQNRGQVAHTLDQMNYLAGYSDGSRHEYFSQHVHVIEHSAYLQVCEQVNALKAEITNSNKFAQDDEDTIAKLRAELKRQEDLALDEFNRYEAMKDENERYLSQLREHQAIERNLKAAAKKLASALNNLIMFKSDNWQNVAKETLAEYRKDYPKEN